MPDRDDRSDAELAAAISGGDASAFETLYRRHRDWVIALAWRFSGSREEALDIAQEAFTWLLHRLHPPSPPAPGVAPAGLDLSHLPPLRAAASNPASPESGAAPAVPFELRAAMRAVLYPVVRSIAFTRRRRNRTRAIHLPALGRLSLAGRETEAEAAPADAGAERRERQKRLAAALDALSDDHREVVLMRFADDLSISEIATALDVPPGTVKSRLHHAIQSLRNAGLKNL
jgi:RNA polymerase sigma-70 factor (ECF subfamily)